MMHVLKAASHSSPENRSTELAIVESYRWTTASGQSICDLDGALVGAFLPEMGEVHDHFYGLLHILGRNPLAAGVHIMPSSEDVGCR